MSHESMVTLLFFIVLATTFLAGYFYAQLTMSHKRENQAHHAVKTIIRMVTDSLERAEKLEGVDLSKYFPFVEVSDDSK